MELPVTKAVNDALRNIAKRLGNGEVSVGFLEGATYPDGTPVATVMFWNEFGHGGHFPSPPRPYFRTMITKKSPMWPEQMGALCIATNNDGAKVLALMGEQIEGDLKESIVTTNVAPLSPTTLALRKKFGNNPQNITFDDVLQAQKDAKDPSNLATGSQAKPGVWTGHALASTGYEVRR